LVRKKSKAEKETWSTFSRHVEGLGKCWRSIDVQCLWSRGTPRAESAKTTLGGAWGGFFCAQLYFFSALTGRCGGVDNHHHHHRSRSNNVQRRHFRHRHHLLCTENAACRCPSTPTAAAGATTRSHPRHTRPRHHPSRRARAPAPPPSPGARPGRFPCSSLSLTSFRRRRRNRHRRRRRSSSLPLLQHQERQPPRRRHHPQTPPRCGLSARS